MVRRDDGILLRLRAVTAITSVVVLPGYSRVIAVTSATGLSRTKLPD